MGDKIVIEENGSSVGVSIDLSDNEGESLIVNLNPRQANMAADVTSEFPEMRNEVSALVFSNGGTADLVYTVTAGQPWLTIFSTHLVW